MSDRIQNIHLTLGQNTQIRVGGKSRKLDPALIVVLLYWTKRGKPIKELPHRPAENLTYKVSYRQFSYEIDGHRFRGVLRLLQRGVSRKRVWRALCRSQIKVNLSRSYRVHFPI